MGLHLRFYVAESSETGGTWSGVIDGLRKGRIIYVRKPDLKEKNANNILISKGGKAVDIAGNLTTYEIPDEVNSLVSKPGLNTTEEKNYRAVKIWCFPC